MGCEINLFNHYIKPTEAFYKDQYMQDNIFLENYSMKLPVNKIRLQEVTVRLNIAMTRVAVPDERAQVIRNESSRKHCANTSLLPLQYF